MWLFEFAADPKFRFLETHVCFVCVGLGFSLIDRARKVGHRNEMSLVLTARDDSGNISVEWVNWQPNHGANELFGQPIFMDKANKAKFSMHSGPFAHPYRSYRGCTILHPAIGIESPKRQSLHQAATVRPNFPPRMLQLRNIYNLAVSASVGPCVFLQFIF